MQNHLSGVDKGVRVDKKNAHGEDYEGKDITIEDCFAEFKKPELLDEDNKWYCNKCKEHV